MSNFGIKEPPLESQEKNSKALLPFIKESIAIVKKDRDFILFFFVAGTAMCGYSLLQFYTVYAKTHLQVSNYMLTYYLIVQVSASSIGSLFLGHLADKYGNRLVLRIIAMLLVLIPLSAVTIGTWVDLPFRQWLYCIVYFMVGFGLPVIQTLINYLLEISPLEKHPNYISIYNTFSCVFFIFPLIIGLLMDHFYYNKVFLGISIFMVIGIVLSQKLVEPRHLLDGSEYQEEVPLG
jgi:MFS family permease